MDNPATRPDKGMDVSENCPSTCINTYPHSHDFDDEVITGPVGAPHQPNCGCSSCQTLKEQRARAVVTLPLGPSDRDWWTLEIDIIPGEPTLVGHIINRHTGELRMVKATVEAGNTGTALGKVMATMFLGYREV